MHNVGDRALTCVLLVILMSLASSNGRECGENPMKQVLLIAKRTGRSLDNVLTVLRDVAAPTYEELARRFRMYAACVGLVDTGYFRKRSSTGANKSMYNLHKDPEWDDKLASRNDDWIADGHLPSQNIDDFQISQENVHSHHHSLPVRHAIDNTGNFDQGYSEEIERLDRPGNQQDLDVSPNTDAWEAPIDRSLERFDVAGNDENFKPIATKRIRLTASQEQRVDDTADVTRNLRSLLMKAKMIIEAEQMTEKRGTDIANERERIQSQNGSNDFLRDLYQ